MKKRLFLGVAFAVTAMFSNVQATTWAVDFSNAIIKRWPTTINAMTGKGWEYSNGIVLNGIQKVYERTKDVAYLNYIKNYVDAYVSSNGAIGTSDLDTTAESLDKYQPGVLCLFLHKETGQEKYKIAADYIRMLVARQPKNSLGGFWHKKKYPDQMWTDGIFMAEPFIAQYGFRLNDMGYCDSTATFQPALLYSKAYVSTSKLIRHAWDESKKAAWADASTGLSPCVWSRGMGWYCAGMVDILKYLPKNHSQYSAMITILGNIAEGIKNSQDAATGLWHQVTDQPNLSGNLIESSGSGLFIYTLKTAVDYGFIDKSYLAVAEKAWTGFKTKCTLDGQGLPVINGFVGATSAGVLADYIAATLVSCPTDVAPHGYCAALFASCAMELQTVPKFRLNITVAGQGSVTNPAGEMFQDSGTTVTLTAVAASGYHLDKWSGDASGSATATTVAMNGEKTVTATFTQGSGLIKSSPSAAGGKAFLNQIGNSTKIVLTLPAAQKVSIELFNGNGQVVSNKSYGLLQTGNHIFDLKTAGLHAGVHFIRVHDDNAMHTGLVTSAE